MRFAYRGRDASAAAMKKCIVNVFGECVKSVLPGNAVRNALTFDSRTLCVNGTDEFRVRNDVRVVGFGKAVLHMALQTVRILNGRVNEALVSVPHGSVAAGFDDAGGKLRAMEAADNNEADERAVRNTGRIRSAIGRLKDDDTLIVLISGGGSALLCSPTVPLADKVRTTRLLSSRGASIEHLNTVRKALSNVKGGRLLESVGPSVTVVSLVLSDVIGDSLSAIASGPTVPNDDADELPMELIDRYGVRDDVPPTVLNALRANRSFRGAAASRAHNYVIGNNAIALRAGVERAAETGYAAALLTERVSGDVSLVSEFYSDLVLFVCAAYDGRNDRASGDRLASVARRIGADDVAGKVAEASSKRGGNGVCLLAGGEPTVRVRGRGLGGRNQELALRVSVDLARHRDRLDRFDVMFFSGGTDGIDGPTDACGAFAYPRLVEMARDRGLEPQRYVDDNDSYGFYSSFDDGRDLLKTGHTGTNVMDVHVLIVRPKTN